MGACPYYQASVRRSGGSKGKPDVHLDRLLEDKYAGETLNQWLCESNKAWHRVRLNQPDSSNWSNSVALSADFISERNLVPDS